MTSKCDTTPVGITLVGAGEFGKTFMAQVARSRSFALAVVCDRLFERAR